MRPPSILNPIHFNSLEKYFSGLLSMYSDFAPPQAFEHSLPFFYVPTDQELVGEAVGRLMDVLRKLNVLSHALNLRHQLTGQLDSFIEESYRALITDSLARIIDDREAYNAIRVLLYHIRPDIIEDKIAPLDKKEKKAIFFLVEMYNSVAHYILEKQEDPLENGEIY